MKKTDYTYLKGKGIHAYITATLKEVGFVIYTCENLEETWEYNFEVPISKLHGLGDEPLVDSIMEYISDWYPSMPEWHEDFNDNDWA